MTPWSNIINVNTTTNSFVSIWKPYTEQLQIFLELPINTMIDENYSSDFTVEWGDGTSTSYVGSITESIYKYYNDFQELRTIVIKGNIPPFNGNVGNSTGGSLFDIKNWGGFVIYEGSFYGNRYSQVTSISASDIPTVRSMGNNFSSWTSLTSITNIEYWDLSDCIDASGAFAFSPNYNINQVLSWNMSNIRGLRLFFYNPDYYPFANTFNFNLSSWNLSSLQSFDSAFGGTQCLTGVESVDISNLDNIDLVQSLNEAEYSGTTTIDLSGWSFDKLRTLRLGNLGPKLNTTVTSFNISDKNTYNLIEVSFVGLTNYNEDISNWNTASLSQLSAAFLGCSSFNQPIGKWNTSNLVSLLATFDGATSFNQPLSTWDTSNVVNLVRTFKNATSFNQDISSWNVEKVQSFEEFMSGKSSENYNYQYYDNILNSWSEQNVLTNKILDMGTIKYSSNGTTGKNKLINDYGWTIIDGGLI